jgi:hypothetical protein
MLEPLILINRADARNASVARDLAEAEGKLRKLTDSTAAQ